MGAGAGSAAAGATGGGGGGCLAGFRSSAAFVGCGCGCCCCCLGVVVPLLPPKRLTGDIRDSIFALLLACLGGTGGVSSCRQQKEGGGGRSQPAAKTARRFRKGQRLTFATAAPAGLAFRASLIFLSSRELSLDSTSST